MSATGPNLAKLSPSGIAAAIRHMRETGISLYVHGAPGISKSAVSKQVADGYGIAFIDFRLTSVAPEDIRGVPVVDDVGGVSGLIWTPPLVFPRDLDLVGTVKCDGTSTIRFYNPIGNNGIHYCKEPQIEVKVLEKDRTAEIEDKQPNRFTVVVRDNQGEVVPGTVLWTVVGNVEAIFGLEEFNSAAPSVMAAAYQLVLDRRIGDYVVPDGVMLLAMGNRDGDKGVTFKIPKPVANRFDHLEMEVNFDDWQHWAVSNNIHPDVVGYLSHWKTHLFEDKFAERPDHSFATPRSWEFVSRIISTETMPSMPVLRALICGAIGNVVGTTFLSHRDFMADMPSVQGILGGAVTTFSPKDPKFRTQIAYSTCVHLCYELKKESDMMDRKYRDPREVNNSPERQKWLIRADRALGYAMDNFAPEVLVVFNRMALQIHRLRFSSTHMKRFLEFASMYRSTILN